LVELVELVGLVGLVKKKGPVSLVTGLAWWGW